MNRNAFTLGSLGAAFMLAAACSNHSDDDLGVGARLSVDYLGDSDVVGFHYLIERVSCDPGDPIEPFSFEALVDLQDQLAPGGVTVLGVLDGESGHIFADVFVSLDPGCYDVTATPVQEMDAGAGTYTASDDCAAASADGVEVLEEETTDAPVLISQCEGDPIGGGDFPAALNHPPQFTLAIDDKFGFVCEVLEACASVSDPDNDPLELDWTQSAGGALYEPISVGALTQTGQEGGVRQYEQCAEFVSEAAGEYELSVTVYDLLGNGTRIEDALDPGQESHATLSFPLNTSTGVEPACIDGGGSVVPLGDPIDRRAGCSFQTDAQYYCDAGNAAADGFDLNDTCPGGVFDPNAVYPTCSVMAPACGPDCSLLMHFDGDYTDDGPFAHVFVPSGGMPDASAAGVFGTGVSFANDHLVAPDHPGFAFDDDFTVDFWFSTTDVTAGLYHHGTSQRGFAVHLGDLQPGTTSPNAINVWAWGDGPNPSWLPTAAVVNDGAWHHVAVTREAGLLHVFVDGTLEATRMVTGPLDQPFSAFIGQYPTVASYTGSIDELRIVDGTAGWTANFTPPALPYTYP